MADRQRRRRTQDEPSDKFTVGPLNAVHIPEVRLSRKAKFELNSQFGATDTPTRK